MANNSPSILISDREEEIISFLKIGNVKAILNIYLSLHDLYNKEQKRRIEAESQLRIIRQESTKWCDLFCVCKKRPECKVINGD
jgi:hypothetical protein